jgi:hypothetical protein
VPFCKNDPNINRNGRATKLDELRAEIALVVMDILEREGRSLQKLAQPEAELAKMAIELQVTHAVLAKKIDNLGTQLEQIGKIVGVLEKTDEQYRR